MEEWAAEHAAHPVGPLVVPVPPTVLSLDHHWNDVMRSWREHWDWKRTQLFVAKRRARAVLGRDRWALIGRDRWADREAAFDKERLTDMALTESRWRRYHETHKESEQRARSVTHPDQVALGIQRSRAEIHEDRAVLHAFQRAVAKINPRDEIRVGSKLKASRQELVDRNNTLQRIRGEKIREGQSGARRRGEGKK